LYYASVGLFLGILCRLLCCQSSYVLIKHCWLLKSKWNTN